MLRWSNRRALWFVEDCFMFRHNHLARSNCSRSTKCQNGCLAFCQRFRGSYKCLERSRYVTNLRKRTKLFKNMFRQFFCHLQFWITQSAKLNLKCVTKCWLDKTNNSNMMMTKWRFLPLNVASFFDHASTT